MGRTAKESSRDFREMVELRIQRKKQKHKQAKAQKIWALATEVLSVPSKGEKTRLNQSWRRQAGLPPPPPPKPDVAASAPPAWDMQCDAWMPPIMPTSLQLGPARRTLPPGRAYC